MCRLRLAETTVLKLPLSLLTPETIRILHTEHPGNGWGFESPDLVGFIGGAGTYERAHHEAEEAVAFHLEDEPDRLEALRDGRLVIVHHMPGRAAAAGLIVG